MFYHSEEIFIDKFIACLRKLEVTTIPFDNAPFHEGIENMQKLFHRNRAQMGAVANEIAMLFIRNPYEGSFTRFRDAISEQNGMYISFENPDYEKAIIKITNEDAEIILHDENLQISNESLMAYTHEFCQGAGIKRS